MKLPPPATGVELHLAAIHEVLCDIRTALVGGRPAPDPDSPAAIDARFTPSVNGGPIGPEAVKAASSPTKRTRARAPRTT